MAEIYYNGKVYTGQPQLQQAFAVSGGVFSMTGSSEELLASAGPEDVLTDLQGRFVCPGYIDSHMHLLEYGHTLRDAQLSAHTGSLQDVITQMRRHLDAHPPRTGQWLCGRGWNQDYFSDVDRMPDRHDLDSVSTDVPIMITRACGHCCVVNSPGLELAGITARTPSPEGGRIGMENGEPDGRLYDNAIELVNDVMPLPQKEDLKEMIRLACRALNAFGVTSAQTDDYCVFRRIPFEVVNEAYRELEVSGELTVRVYEQSNFTSLNELKRFVESGNVTGAGSDVFRIGPLKMLGDGALGSRTAHLTVPYPGTDGDCGFSLFSQKQMNEMISYANAHGMQVAVHAIGDACLDEVLDAVDLALKEHPRADHRHGIVHCQVSRGDQLQRMMDLKMHVYAQSIFLDYDNHIVETLIPLEMAQTSYSWKTLMKGGVTVSNGSDCPVEQPDVMTGMQCAVTRCSLDGTGPYLPREAFTVREALDSFTVCGAYASFEENHKGRIAPGYLADFTVLDGNPFETDLEKISKIPVAAAYLGGKQVYGQER